MKYFHKFRWLVGIALAAGAVSLLRGDAMPAVRGISDFHHTEWKGLGAVFDIKQSSEGYLWLTTSKGVLRFDGVRFQSLAEVTRGAVQDSEIDSVFLSSTGGLWLTTEGAGLVFWKDGHLSTFPDRRCTPTRKLGKIVEDSDGTLWVQAAAGLFRLRGSVCEQVNVEQGYPGGFPAGLLLDSAGTLWVKTRTSPLLFLPLGESKFHISNYGEGVSAGYAYLHEAPDGRIWLSDDKGLRPVASKADNKTSAPLQSPPKTASDRSPRFGDFTFASDGSLWAVTGKGVQRFDHVERWRTPVAQEIAPGESFTPREGLSSDAVWKVLVDRECVWVATNSGLDRLRRATLTTIGLPHTQEHEFAVAAGDQSTVWAGNSSLPLTKVAPDGTITTVPGTRQTMGIWRDHDGTIWWAGVGDFRLWRSSGKGLSPLHYPEESLDTVLFVAVDRNNEPWITTSSGRAYRLSHGAWIDQNDALGKKPGVIGAMVDDHSGNVWFGFSNKVVEWDGSTYRRFAFPDGKRGVSENTMSVRGDHVWLGGPGGIQLVKDGHFYLMHWKDRRLPGRVSGIVETDTGDLWINGFSGITHVTGADLRNWIQDPESAVSADHFDELDGLPGLSGETLPQPSVVEAPDGRLWFATTRGIAWLDPSALRRNSGTPLVIISAVITAAKTYAGSNGLTLPARTENLQIDYTALRLAVPERALFRYKLEGVDNDWQDVGTRRQAYYTKLRPGTYKFRVMASNDDGIWDDTGASLDLSISPAWFQTNWFILLCLASLIFVASALYRLRVRQIAGIIKARFDERLAERTRIAQELHDTLLQGFLSASMQVHTAADSLPSDSNVKPVLTRAIQLMTQVIDEGRNAVRGLRTSQSVSLDLEQAFARVQRDFYPPNINGPEVEFRIVVEGQRRPLHPLIRDEIYRIGREALTNAFRHSAAKRIDVEMKYSSNQFRLVVRDDGRGIEPDVLLKGRDGHWGLPGMKERADRIGARLQVFSSASAGTEVELLVPARVAFQDQNDGKFRWRWRNRPPEAVSDPHTGAEAERDKAGQYIRQP